MVSLRPTWAAAYVGIFKKKGGCPALLDPPSPCLHHWTWVHQTRIKPQRSVERRNSPSLAGGRKSVKAPDKSSLTTELHVVQRRRAGCITHRSGGIAAETEQRTGSARERGVGLRAGWWGQGCLTYHDTRLTNH